MSWAGLVTLGLALAAVPAQAPLRMPVGHVEGQIVVYPRDPELRVTVPATATYLGADRSILEELSDCEMHIFVEADASRRVRRFYWVHFESYLPTRLNDRMTYGDIDRRSRLWGTTTWIREGPARGA